MDETQRTDKLPTVESFADGVNVVEGVPEQPGIDTLEGRIGLLLQGEDVQSQYIAMPPGMFTPEHAHETESIIFTIDGPWVLCSDGKRRVMESGDIFWFGSGVPTGYEMPPHFSDEATILIFKGERSEGSRDGFVEYVTEEMNPTLEAQRAEGTPFTFEELDDDHPAVTFASSLAES
jgi:quercetin dioxygenase-like cupin family protein